MDFLELFIKNEGIHPKYLRDRQLTIRSGEVELFKPTGRDEERFNEVHAEYLHALNDRLTGEGFREFEYLGHGEHAFVANARNKQGLNRVLRIHLGPLFSRESTNVFKADRCLTLDNVISCEEMNYLEIVHTPSPKLVLGLTVACFAEGWDFWDNHGRNIAMAIGETRIGVLEPHAVRPIHPSSSAAEEIVRRETTTAEGGLNVKRYRYREQYEKNPEQYYCQGDVVETTGHIVVLLDGDYYAAPTRPWIAENPKRNNRKLAALGFLEQFLVSHEIIDDRFIVIKQADFGKVILPSGNPISISQSLRDILQKVEIGVMVKDADLRTLAMITSMLRT